MSGNIATGGFDCHFPFAGKLYGVANQIDQYLSNPLFVANHSSFAENFFDININCNVFFMSLWLEQLYDLGKHAGKQKRQQFKLKLVCLDLRQIKNVINKCQQKISRRLYRQGKIFLPVIQLCNKQEVSKAKN
ncbi:MAG: hypothetical protein ACD_39C01548G0003 [uncultured bacterium]|nr:MAG: hypothetical protein ACD_39C01548G0003 [uncultured bacterium]